MKKLSLLFTKDGLQWHISKGKSVLEEAFHFVTEETSPHLVEEKLDDVLKFDDYKEIEVISALNHFSLTPDSFTVHELGYKLISYNAPVDEANEESQRRSASLTKSTRYSNFSILRPCPSI